MGGAVHTFSRERSLSTLSNKYRGLSLRKHNRFKALACMPWRGSGKALLGDVCRGVPSRHNRASPTGLYFPGSQSVTGVRKEH